MLDNAELISTLEETKNKALELSQRLLVSHQTSMEVEQLRDAFRFVASCGASLYFCLASLSRVNPMYEYSLSSFLHVFDTALCTSKPDPVLSKRLTRVVEMLQWLVYSHACTGLFGRHKLLFSLQMTLAMVKVNAQNEILSRSPPQIIGDASTNAETGAPPSSEPAAVPSFEVHANELEFLLFGSKSLSTVLQSPFKWITAHGWKDLNHLRYLAPCFSVVVESILAHEEAWLEWVSGASPESTPMPFLDNSKVWCRVECGTDATTGSQRLSKDLPAAVLPNGPSLQRRHPLHYHSNGREICRTSSHALARTLRAIIVHAPHSVYS